MIDKEHHHYIGSVLQLRATVVHRRYGTVSIQKLIYNQSALIFLVTGPRQVNSLPNRSSFSWDSKKVPCTDAKRYQEDYSKAEKLWCAFNNALPDSNSMKIPAEIRDIGLKSQLYGRTTDLFTGIEEENLIKQGDVKLILEYLYQRYAL